MKNETFLLIFFLLTCFAGKPCEALPFLEVVLSEIRWRPLDEEEEEEEELGGGVMIME